MSTATIHLAHDVIGIGNVKVSVHTMRTDLHQGHCAVGVDGYSEQDYRNALDARDAVAELIELHKRLVAWNHNINGNGVELGEICRDAEAALARVGGPS
jgi:hypothetical protein